MITLDTEHPPVGLWFASLGDDVDFLACLKRSTENPQHYDLDFRFRYHKDEKVFDSEDVKHWYHLMDKDSKSDDECVAKIRNVVLRMCESVQDNKPDMVEMLYKDYPDMHAFLEAFQNQPFAYSKQVSNKEAEEKYGVPPKV